MLLKNLIKNISKNKKNIFISGLSSNSKEIRKNYIFFAIKGDKINGEKYINDAMTKGASAIVCSNKCKIKNKILSNDNIQIIDNLHTSNEVSTFLKDMDLFFFNSSCENFPNILIEGMASGLPIVTTNIEPMNEIVNEK